MHPGRLGFFVPGGFRAWVFWCWVCNPVLGVCNKVQLHTLILSTTPWLASPDRRPMQVINRPPCDDAQVPLAVAWHEVEAGLLCFLGDGGRRHPPTGRQHQPTLQQQQQQQQSGGVGPPEGQQQQPRQPGGVGSDLGAGSCSRGNGPRLLLRQEGGQLLPLDGRPPSCLPQSPTPPSSTPSASPAGGDPIKRAARGVVLVREGLGFWRALGFSV